MAEVNVDISERKKAEEALRKAHGELERKVQERTKELAQATEIMKGEIIERFKVERELRASQGTFRNIFDNSPDGIALSDLNSNVLEVNKAMLELHRLSSKEEIIGKSFLTFIHPDDQYWVRDEHPDSAKTYEHSSIFRGKKADGTPWMAEVTGAIIKDREGNPYRLVSILRDVTERLRIEKEVQELQEQLRQAQKMEAIGRLAGGVAHDFNNLLTIIKGSIQLSLLKLKKTDPLWENTQEIHKATEQAVNLTCQLLTFSRRQVLDLKVIDLNGLLKGLEKMLRRVMGEDIQLVFLLDENLGRVKGDMGQIEQVILNLAINAKDAMPLGGDLIIETTNIELKEGYVHSHIGVIPGRYVLLSVSDTGSGRAKEVKEKAFEPFFTTKEEGKGTGLGLSTVYGIVKQSGGNIWIYSEPGQGTTFKIYLPWVEQEAEVLGSGDEKESLPRGSETVLIVEDDSSVRDVGSRILKQLGYNILEATSGGDALGIAEKCPGDEIHLLLTDVVMPQMSGKELADQLRISRPGIKVLYVSGYTDETVVQYGVLTHEAHFLQKPFSPKMLAHKMREVLDRH